jgi:hypothetical protein
MQHVRTAYLFFFSFTFFIWTQTWKIVVSNYASCAAILFIYVRSRSRRATIFHLLPGGIHCIYLKSRDYKSANRARRSVFTPTSYPGSFHYAPRWRKALVQAGHVSPRFWEITIGTYGGVGKVNVAFEFKTIQGVWIKQHKGLPWNEVFIGMYFS